MDYTKVTDPCIVEVVKGDDGTFTVCNTNEHNVFDFYPFDAHVYSANRWGVAAFVNELLDLQRRVPEVTFLVVWPDDL